VGTQALPRRASDLPGLGRVLAARFPGLGPRLRQAARYLLDHPEDVALLSMRQAASAARVHPATMVRLARALGFAGYPAIRSLFVQRLRRRPSSYASKAVALQRRGGAGADHVVRQAAVAHARNVHASFELNAPGRLRACAEALEAARTVYVIGLRSCFPLAFFFHYVYRLFRENAILLDGQAGTFPDGLRGMRSRDVLFAISLSPYSGDTVRAVDFARRRGATVVALTDSQLSPLARRTRLSLLFTAETPSFFHSVTAAMAMVETLLALLVARGGRETVRAIHESEAQLSAFAAYWRERREE
jgi:DNA-binding MurR/RpiR family transcriptional regulator